MSPMEGLAGFWSKLRAITSLVHLNMRLAKVDYVLAEVAENILRSHFDYSCEQALLFGYNQKHRVKIIQCKKDEYRTYKADM